MEISKAEKELIHFFTLLGKSYPNLQKSKSIEIEGKKYDVEIDFKSENNGEDAHFIAKNLISITDKEANCTLNVIEDILGGYNSLRYRSSIHFNYMIDGKVLKKAVTCSNPNAKEKQKYFDNALLYVGDKTYSDDIIYTEDGYYKYGVNAIYFHQKGDSIARYYYEYDTKETYMNMPNNEQITLTDTKRFLNSLEKLEEKFKKNGLYSITMKNMEELKETVESKKNILLTAKKNLSKFKEKDFYSSICDVFPNNDLEIYKIALELEKDLSDKINIDKEKDKKLNEEREMLFKNLEQYSEEDLRYVLSRRKGK